MARYATPEAFRQALEQRIRAHAQTIGMDMGRFRQLLVFDRFLARLVQVFGSRLVLKGGVVLELRLHRARTTKDVDLRVTGDVGRLLDELQQAGRLDLGDFLSFLVTPDRDHPTIRGEGVPYEGQRFQVEPRLGGKRYGSPFGLDVGVADRLVQPPEEILSSSLFEFAGIAPSKLLIYPREAHVAEKLHAYTLPRPTANTRVKDLPDLALLGRTGPFEASALRAAIEATFAHRGTHPVPREVPDPPAPWESFYDRMVKVDGLPWSNLVELRVAVGAFLDPLLRGGVGAWDPERWRWVGTPTPEEGDG